jgi:hypothetical protein
MKWQHKYAIQKALSILPFNAGFYANQLLSRRFGGLRKKEFYGFPNTLAMVSLLERLGFRIEGKRFIELGTGWDGSAGMVLLSLGAQSVHTFDLFPHLDQTLLEQVLQSFSDLSPFTSGVFPFEADLPSVAARCDRSKIDRSRFHYFAPHDARSLGLPDAFGDYYYSQAVFEHVPEAESLSTTFSPPCTEHGSIRRRRESITSRVPIGSGKRSLTMTSRTKTACAASTTSE